MASASPRRQEYFRLLGLPFTVVSSPVDESFDPRADVHAVVNDLALKKVTAVRDLLASRGETPPWICGADTLVALDGVMYGKPLDKADARRMIGELQGKTHEVVSALALCNNRANCFDCRSVSSEVTFAPLSEAEIEWYLDSTEYRDAAGAYKIQGLASCFVTSIQGSYSAIVGLPLHTFYVMLHENGYSYGA